MKVAVVGTGNMGAAFAKALDAAGIEIIIGHRDFGKAAALAAKIGSGVESGGVSTAIKVADISILALPYPSILEVLQAAGALDGKIIVDISNPITADYKDLLLGHTSSAAEQIQSAAPTARVVKAFNTIFANLIPRQGRNEKLVQVFVAGNDADATARVRGLAEKLAFEAIDAGPLTNSRFLEPIGEMNIHFGFFLGWGPTAAPAWVRF
ncbi:NADPH-dependent F420 reductase [Rhizobium sp. BK060]|uniref:NADPH-dependent F420 reductase n=1 Tax=Rhizobium sp. BK060 TaxID=2587096 RepID=UPI00161F76AD|nr:NADPH-dependent F420 reductase [Rhizobium sp. BK060]MBB3398787.1 hypothetical protein [Rhizobium sp. BK060]